MSKIFEHAERKHEVHGRIAALQQRFYPDHVAVELTCDVVFVDLDDADAEETTPALKLHGYPCDAIVRIVSVKDRAKGLADIEIQIDRRRYQGMTPEERDALLDHELHHVEIKKDRHQKPQVDGCGRPKLKMKLHDHEFGWFTEIARRHREASAEVQQARRLMDRAGQFYWPDLCGQSGKGEGRGKVVSISSESLRAATRQKAEGE